MNTPASTRRAQNAAYATRRAYAIRNRGEIAARAAQLTAPPRLLTIEQAAHRLHIRSTSVRRYTYAARGNTPLLETFVRMTPRGPRRFIVATSFDAYLDRRNAFLDRRGTYLATNYAAPLAA